MPSIQRVLDANANRAREALRVMEDAARFILNNASLTEAIKRLRHDLAAVLTGCPAMEENRDTARDVGTRITTEQEMTRGSAADVTIAAGKRLSESLRVLEEYAKTLGGDDSTDIPSKMEALRYRGYEIERRLVLAIGSGQKRQWRLCVLISQDLCPHGDWRRIAQAVVESARGSGKPVCIQLREKSVGSGELLQRGCELVSLCRPWGVSVVINDRPDIAMMCGADGVHVGQTDTPCEQVRRLVGRQLLIGVSTANLEQACEAIRQGADYCGVGPMFDSSTKPNDQIPGPEYLEQFIQTHADTPHLAIGGISTKNIKQLIHIGANGVAVSSSVCASENPGDEVTRLLKEFKD